MPSQDRWLSLQLIDKKEDHKNLKSNFFISVPKKIVPKAHDRNKIKRLVREAARLSDSFLEKGKICRLRVVKNPVRPTLKVVQAELGLLGL